MRHFLFAALLWLGLGADLSEAKFIRLVVDTRISAGTDLTQRKLIVVVENQGDEPAYEVGLEVIGVKDTALLTEKLEPGTHVEHRQAISLEELGITGEGRFAIQMRILYRDGNRYPFSAPSLTNLDIGGPPARTVAVIGPQGRPPTTIELFGRKETKLVLRGLSEQSAMVEKISFLTAAELPAQIEPATYPIELTAQAQLPVSITLTPLGTLPGSTYPGLIIVDGTVNGVHFSEPFPLSVAIVAPPPPPAGDRLMIVAFIICVAAAVFLLWKLRYGKPSRDLF